MAPIVAGGDPVDDCADGEAANGGDDQSKHFVRRHGSSLPRMILASQCKPTEAQKQTTLIASRKFDTLSLP